MKKLDFATYQNKKCGLVLSGGVIKAAAWHLGVCLALEDLGFSLNSKTNLKKSMLDIECFVGSSAGAFICMALTQGYSAQEIIDETLGINNSSSSSLRYKDIFHIKPKEIISNLFLKEHTNISHEPSRLNKFLKGYEKISGFFSIDGVRDYCEQRLIKNNNFNDLERDLYIVASYLDHSKKAIFSKHKKNSSPHCDYINDVSISDAISASMSVPPFYRPYKINTERNDHYMIDGEIRDTLSTHIAEDHGCELIISSWTHTPYHFSQDTGSLIKFGLPAIAVQSIYLMIQKKIVNAREKKHSSIQAFNQIHAYLKDNQVKKEVIDKTLELLKSNLNFNPDTKYIDIYPDHHDHKFFFSSYFSLNPKHASYAVVSGYKKTVKTIKSQMNI